MARVEIRSDSTVPMYRQLGDLIRERIGHGHLRVGERIPSEAQLGDRFGVSRITVRQALSELEREGLLERVPGKGTFVREPIKKIERLTRLTGFGENMAALGLRAGYKTLRAEEILALPEVADRLEIAGRRAFVVERKLLADDRPVGVHTSYLPLWLVGRASEDAFSRGSLDRNSLYQAIEESGVTMQRAEEVVEPMLAGAWEAEQLDAKEGDLALRIRRTVYDENDRPVEYVIITYRADSYTFRINLYRV